MADRFSLSAGGRQVKRRVLDSDTLSYLIKGLSPAMERAKAYLRVHPRLSFGIITYYEVRRGLLYRDARRQLPLFEELANRSEVIALDMKVADVAAAIYADLRRQGWVIADADLLIAATAIAHDAILVTSNEAHYARIPGLELENWMELKEGDEEAR